MGGTNAMGATDEAGELLRRLQAVGARHLWVVYHNHSALAQAKSVEPGRFAEVARDGVSFAKANWDFAITDEQHPHPGFAADSGDFRVVPDPASLVRIPYRDGVWQVYGWLVDDIGEPWAGDPRARLRDQVAALAEHGTARVAFESEFFLARREGDGWVPADHGRMFTVDEIEARWDWSARVLDALDASGVGVHQFAKEYGPAQYELSLFPADPLTAVDRFCVARQVVRALAREVGLVATFMPKPWTDRPANGIHVHLSLVDRDGREMIPDPDDPDGLSPAGRAVVAGLLEHAAGQAALGAPTPNSYKRLLPGSWAPAHRCWGLGNRAALVRVPGRGPNRHLEYRLADASANPYHLVTGLLAASVDGLERRPALPDPAAIDVGHLSDSEAAALGFERLPSSPGAALDALEADRVLCAALGPLVVEHFLAIKRFELDAYLAATGLAPGATEVTDWERDAYLEHV